MGISWSSNRRRNNYLQNRPPPPSELLSEPPSLLPPSQPPPTPPPPNPPLPPPDSNSFTSNPPYSPPPYPPRNLSPAHTPPIHSLSPYCSGPYNFSNYANPMMGRSNYQLSYSDRSNYWTPIRPPVAAPLLQQPPPPSQQQQQPPPLHVRNQRAMTVRNDVNVYKNTLRLEVDERNPGHYLVSFSFCACLDGSITIYYFAKEESNCRFSLLFPEAFVPVTIPFQKGLSQKFRQPSGTGIDLGFFELDDLSKPSPGGDVFPLVICAEASPPFPNGQITQAVLEKQNKDLFQVRVIRQILWVNEVRYELQEIYGLVSPVAEGFNDNDSGKECVICLTEPKTTTVLPCRHMCMCSECAKGFRLQSNKCPICRQPIEKLLEIKINNSDQ